MKVAVTGGSGQLGTLVLRRLIADPTVKEIVSLDVRPPSVVSGKLRPVTWDVRNHGIEQHLEGCEALFHFAFIVTKRAHKDMFWGVNVEGSQNVFRGAVTAGVKSVVYASSIAAYGVVEGHPNPIVEDTPRKHQPDFPYSATKFEVEAFLDDFEPKHPDVAFARLRPTILVGERMEHALGRMLKARRLPVSGTAPMPIVWDEDVADAAILAMKKRARGAFNVSADELLRPGPLARATGLRVLYAPRPIAVAFAKMSPLLEQLGIGEAMDTAWITSGEVTMVPSCARAKTELGWKPRFATATSVIEHYLDVVPARADRRIAVFFKLLAINTKKVEVPEENRRIVARVHLRLTGPGGGDFGLVVDHGALSVLTDAPRPPTSIVTLPAALFLDLLAGKTDVSHAQNVSGTMRVEGEPSAALIVGSIVEAFRQGRAKAGTQGRIARALGKWFAREVVA